MPGPEATGATPPPPPAPAPADADVIDFQQRRALANSQRQDATVTLVPDEQPADPGLQPMAMHAEALFQHHQRTLTDPQTAQAFRIALDLAQGILDAARGQQHITEDAHRRIHGTLATARRAPDAL
ncbi:hypothetical protein [Streptomyces sp. NPDC093589]|uniref:hypothetical protein n=1 Tax=Streptomyces sp. NPDC093589 TaxID=3366043 RepID=UPI0037F43E01